jgi:hypothetical protein
VEVVKIIGKILTIAKMMPVIEKEQLQNVNELISKIKGRQEGYCKICKKKLSVYNDGEICWKHKEGEFLTSREYIINLNENELKFRCDCTTENGEENYNKINREYKDRDRKGDQKAVPELLGWYPHFWFTNERYVERRLKEHPVKSGRKPGSTVIDRTLITATVDALEEKGCLKKKAFEFFKGIGDYRSKALYYDTKRKLINEPFTVSSIPKSGEYEPTDLVEYTFLFLKPGVKIGPEEAKAIKAIMAQMG